MDPPFDPSRWRNVPSTGGFGGHPHQTSPGLPYVHHHTPRSSMYEDYANEHMRQQPPVFAAMSTAMDGSTYTRTPRVPPPPIVPAPRQASYMRGGGYTASVRPPSFGSYCNRGGRGGNYGGRAAVPYAPYATPASVSAPRGGVTRYSLRSSVPVVAPDVDVPPSSPNVASVVETRFVPLPDPDCSMLPSASFIERSPDPRLPEVRSVASDVCGTMPIGLQLASCDPARPDQSTVVNEAARAGREAQARIRRRDYNVVFWGNSIHELAARLQTPEMTRRVRYGVMQREVCPTTGRPHWQMYFEFNQPESIPWVKEVLLDDNTAHVQIRLTSREQCRAYCRKTYTRMSGPPTEVGPFEYGTWQSRGSEQKMQQIREAIADGREVADIAIDDPNVVFRHRVNLEWFADTMRQREAQTKNRTVTVRLFVGPTGCGKTHLAREEALYYSGGDAGKIFILDSGGKDNALWFDGYRYGRTLIIDDYDSWIPVAFLLRLLDKYPLRLPVKGSTKWALYEEVWLTSNKPLEQWTEPGGRPIDPRHFEALYRRISWILFLPHMGEYEIVKKPHEPLRTDLPTCEEYVPTPVNSVSHAPVAGDVGTSSLSLPVPAVGVDTDTSPVEHEPVALTNDTASLPLLGE
jgi:hypothetical protein